MASDRHYFRMTRGPYVLVIGKDDYRAKILKNNKGGIVA
jgi:hypothetical protein